eukprot:Plantae.Rhodophyta-Purpureofilum_apyrenoidigerum.ctg11380.p1 GENE.Plantae.Rhodophyta-Purpureofilum_apyrenoidigerum.ctg11380~~Plantae.Rhodophyta-Purpureofilum_apyrenoidigerum.ctg11380.p1  ORF type:complete len:400 (-),score=69.66 Plantae.Rhodophyta-Purpureofilum_apyrenoidigerum.ctg11380:164-1246(-)
MSAFVPVSSGSFVAGSRDVGGNRRGLCATGPSRTAAQPRVAPVMMAANMQEIRGRINSVKNTQKITEAMKLVAAAKVRRAQDAVLKSRPFSESLQKVLGGLLKRLKREMLDVPLLQERKVQKVMLCVITGDRGLCGSYNSYMLKKAENRIKELKAEGLEVCVFCIGNKGSQYFKRRGYEIVKAVKCGQAPTNEDASDISDALLSSYLSGEVDRVELLYTCFVSLIASNPSVRTLVPLNPTGLETEGDELFQLTTKEGKFVVTKEKVPIAEAEEFPRDMIFEQDPIQILNALLPLYLNGQLLRTLQESIASELASRMSAMSAASDNAKSLRKGLTLEYNRARQASITQELMEIISGAAALE